MELTYVKQVADVTLRDQAAIYFHLLGISYIISVKCQV
jgi:hypothetical protein